MKNKLIFTLSFAFATSISACDKSGGSSKAPSGALGACPADATIEDGEDGDEQILKHNGRGGWLYTYVDEAGTTVEPEAGAFELAEGGANGTQRSMQMKGKTASDGGDIYVGMGFGFTHPTKPYDASAYGGITFWAKKGPGSTGNVRVKIPDANTDPAGKICSECYNDFGYDLTLTEEWKQYTVSFEDMKQGEGWGAPRPNFVDKSQIFGIQWQVADPGADFDIYIDEIAFVGCDAS